jgi:sugar lactone lactonase YvrE
MSESFEIAFPSQCMLGEGPHYDARTNRLLWVDILGETGTIFSSKIRNIITYERDILAKFSF